MEVTHNHGAKSMLAKLLATENITVQHSPNVKTAMFDVKNRVLILPIWRDISNDLYDLLVVHEVGHALDTPSDFVPVLQSIAARLKGSVSRLKGYLNVIEDARIDKRQKRRYPGSRRNYIKGYQELLERDFFGTARRDVNTMTFIDRINVYFKAGVASGIKFSREELPFIKRIENAETFEEVLQLTEEIYVFSKEKKNQDKQDKQDNQDESEDSDSGDSDDYDWSDDESDDYEDSDDSDSEDSEGESSDESEDESEGDSEDEDGDESDTDTDGEGDEDSEGDKDEDSDSDEDDEDGDLSAGGKDEKYAEEEPDESETDKAWEEKQAELLANADMDYVYLTLPTPTAAVIDDYKVVYSQFGMEKAHDFRNSWYTAVRTELNDFKAKENATISYMVKEFEMRKSADEFSRTSIAKTGVIDTNKLHSYKYNDDIFRRITSVATGKNHGFVMFVDWSGSMDLTIKDTLKQMFSLAWFCKRVQIPFEVYSFRSLNQWDADANSGKHFWSQKNGELIMSPFKLRNILSSRMNIAELNEAMFRLYAFACGSKFRTDNMGSTPLNEAIVAAQVVVERFKAQTRVQVVNTIFLTDGESDGNWYVTGVTDQTNGKKRKFIMQDRVTKKDYDLGVSEPWNSGIGAASRMTATLLKVLKDRTGCNLIGFYIYAEGPTSLMRRFYPKVYDDATQKKILKEYETNGFITVLTEGYDENYILRAQSLKIKSNTLNVDPKKMTNNKIAKQFMEFSEKKSVNRVLLQRFIKKIAA